MRPLLVALAVLTLAGCGTEDESPAEDGGGAERAEPTTSLVVTVWPAGRGGGPEETWTLECDPSGGDHPTAEEACMLLAGSPDLLEPLPEDVMCTQQFGGPEQASIRGTVEGRSVDLRYSRANGCEIARWERLAPVLELPAS